jgi:hypothetical protein
MIVGSIVRHPQASIELLAALCKFKRQKNQGKAVAKHGTNANAQARESRKT